MSTDSDADDPEGEDDPDDSRSDGGESGATDPQFAAELLEGAADGVVTADRDRRIVFANPAAAALFGYEPGELDGRPFASLFPESIRPDVHETLDRLVAGEDADRRDVRVPGRHRDGDRIDLSVSLFGHAGDGGEYLSGIVRDVTDRVRRERRLERQNEQLTRLASVLSHDLREPLNNANAKLTLARETGDEEYVDDVVAIHERMGELVDDVLALTTEGLPVEATRPVAIDRVVDGARRTVGDAGLDVRVETTASVVADPDRLQTVFENLLTNAARHAGPAVQVRVGTTADGFFVADDGPGIPADEREAVFDYGVTTSDEGTGLGLSIVRDVARAHGWAVDAVESRDGGVRFEFSGVDVVEAEE